MFWLRRHPIADEDLSAYVDGELDEGMRTRLEAHLEDCAACREALTEIRTLRQTLQDLPRATAPRRFVVREADVGTVPARQTAGGFARLMPAMSGLASAAVLVFAVLVGVDLTGGMSGDGSDKAGSPLGFLQDVEQAPLAPQDEEGALPLGDSAEPASGGRGDDESAMEPPIEDQDYAGDGEAGDASESEDKQPGAGAPLEDDTARLAPCAPDADCPEVVVGSNAYAPTPVPGPTVVTAFGRSLPDMETSEELLGQDDADGPARIRIAEAAAAGVALAAAGGVAFAWWRRRA